MFIFEKNPKNLQKPVEYTLCDGTVTISVVDGGQPEAGGGCGGGGEEPGPAGAPRPRTQVSNIHLSNILLLKPYFWTFTRFAMTPKRESKSQCFISNFT